MAMNNEVILVRVTGPLDSDCYIILTQNRPASTSMVNSTQPKLR